MKSMIATVAAGLMLAACQPAASEEPAAAAPPQEAASAPGFTDAALGVAFDIPAGLTTRPCGESMPDCVGLFREGGDEPMVAIQAFAGDLDTVGREQAGFERNAEGVLMTTYGRFTPQAVQDFAGQGWQGRRAVVICGVSDADTGFHAAGGECLWAVASNGARAVVVTTDGSVAGLAAGDAVLNSLRLTR